MHEDSDADKPELDVVTSDGKYRLTLEPSGMFALRDGRPWRDVTGDTLILALAQDLERTRKQRDGLLAACEMALALESSIGEEEWYASSECPDTFRAIRAAIASTRP